MSSRAVICCARLASVSWLSATTGDRPFERGDAAVDAMDVTTGVSGASDIWVGNTDFVALFSISEGIRASHHTRQRIAPSIICYFSVFLSSGRNVSTLSPSRSAGVVAKDRLIRTRCAGELGLRRSCGTLVALGGRSSVG